VVLRQSVQCDLLVRWSVGQLVPSLLSVRM
jgi:hypothetical protein